MRRIDWNNVQEQGDFTPVAPGGYVAAITEVEDHEADEFLMICWDFVEQPYRGRNTQTHKGRGYWPMRFPRSYKESALGFFKAFKIALEKSNPGYTFREDNLQDMRRKYIGVVIGEEEYIAKDGTVKVRPTVRQTRSVDAIRSGDFKVPALKTLQNGAKAYGGDTSSGFTDLSDEPDDKLPF